jgi:hypothetical protein
MTDQYLTTALRDLADVYGEDAVLEAAHALWPKAVPGGTPHTRSGDPGTSYAAARSIDPDRLRFQQKAILSMLRQAEEGLTHYEMADRWRDASMGPFSESGLRSRTAELVGAQMVKDSGRRRKVSTGRNAIVWVAV